MDKRLMYVVPALIANRKSAILRQPGQCALHNPPVSPQLLAAVYALSLLYGSLSHAFARLLCTSCRRRLWVGVQLLGTLPRSAPARTLNGLYSVDEFFEDHRIVDVCGRERYRKWDSPWVRNKVALGALLCFIRRIVAGFGPPFWRGWKPNRVRHAPSRSGRPLRDDRARQGVASPTPQPLATPSGVASRSSPSRILSPGEASPREYRS